MDVTELGWENIDRNRLPQGRDQQIDLMNIIINNRLAKYMKNFFIWENYQLIKKNLKQ